MTTFLNASQLKKGVMKMIRRLFISGAIISILLCLTTISAFALERCNYSIQLKGTTLDACAFSEEGTMFLPLRALGEAFGYQVEWLAKDRTVVVKNLNDNIVLNYDNDSMLDGKRMIVNGKAYLSEDLVCENLGIVFAQSRTEKIIIVRDIKKDDQTIKVGEIYNVVLKGNPSTGYLWQYTTENDNVVKLDKESFSPDSTLTGADGTFTWKFIALQPGETKLSFKYYRPWESEEKASLTEDYYIKVKL
jgi:predicted secreted protein